MNTELNASFLRQFADNEPMAEAVRAFVVEQARQDVIIPLLGDTSKNDDAQLGQKLRAYCSACDILQNAFLKLADYKGRQSVKNKTNIER